MPSGRHCIVCYNNKENLNPEKHSNPSLFQFPNSPNRRKRWIQGLQLNDTSVKKTSCVCEIHFSKNQFIRTRIKPDAIPSLTPKKKTSKIRPLAPCLLFLPIQSEHSPITSQSDLEATIQIQCPSSTNSLFQKDCSKRKQEEQLERLNKIKKQRLLTQRRRDKRHILRLKSRVEELKLKLKDRVDFKEVFSKNETFKRILEAQVARYKHKKRAYTDFEKTAALSLYYSCGPNGYQTLTKLGLEIPNRTTLWRWTKTIPIFTGVNIRLLSCIKKITDTFDAMDRDCLITWDEMGIKEFIEFNKFYDMFEGIVDFAEHGRTLEAANEVLVFMIRGINASWRFPISFYFSKGATTSEFLGKIVEDNINAVQNIDLKVRMGICDMSFTNQGLYRAWSITPTKPYRVFNNQKVFFIHDTPHLIKLVRNNLMKYVFDFQEGKKSHKIKWSHIRGFYEKDRRVSSRMAPRLTKCHIYLKDYSKMRVKLAVQVFSASVYAAISTMCKLRILKMEFMNTAKFVKKIDEIFDFLNMSSLRNDKFGRCAAHFYSNIGKLDEFMTFFESISVPSMGREPEFLKGLKLTVSSIKMLAIQLYKEGYRYLYTRHLQQDCLENYFSLVRAKGGYCKNPTARGFRTSFRFLFFATLIHTPNTANTESTNNSSFAKYVTNMQSFITSENRNIRGSNQTDDKSKEDTCSTENVGSVHAAAFYSVKLVRKLKYGKEQEAEVASYMGAACIKAIIKFNKCEQCSKMLVARKDVDESKISNYHLIDFKQYDSFSKKLAYLSPDDCDFFKFLNTSFTKITCLALISSGEKILSNICMLYEKESKVSNWISLEPECFNHRVSILKYFVRAKLFQLIKDKNDSLRQIRSWNQTRRDMRNQ